MPTEKAHISLKDTVYSAILEDILSHKYEPKDILNEKMLVELYGCSKTPVREALVSLCNDGVLRNIPRYGYEIVRLTMEDVYGMLQFRYFLESGILASAYLNFTDTQIDCLVEINNECSAAENDLWRHWDWNTKFHVKMLTFCKNVYAAEELQRCMDRQKRAYAQLYWDNLESITFALDTRNHKEIIRGLREKNLEVIISSLKNDLKDFGGLNAIGIKFQY